MVFCHFRVNISISFATICSSLICASKNTKMSVLATRRAELVMTQHSKFWTSSAETDMKVFPSIKCIISNPISWKIIARNFQKWLTISNASQKRCLVPKLSNVKQVFESFFVLQTLLLQNY